MGNYKKDAPRLTVKFIDADTEKTILELKDKTWMDVGELFCDSTTNGILMSELKNKSLPLNVMVIAIGEYTLHTD